MSTKEIQMGNVGLIPERTADPGRAFHLWSSDGAVIISTSRTDTAGVLAGARDVFGPRLFVYQSPTAAASGEIPGLPTYYDYCDAVTQTENGNAGVSLQPH